MDDPVASRIANLLVPIAPKDERADFCWVPMRDGTRLATDVYLPLVASRGPTVLMRVPYGMREEFAMMRPIAHLMVERGFRVVVQDVRGRFRSEGLRIPFVFEVDDGYDTLDWIVQQPFSDGTVGMFGESYYGFTQWAALASGHPSLRAMAGLVTGSELPVWHHRAGTVPLLGAILGWFARCWSFDSMISVEHQNFLDFSTVPVLDTFVAEMAVSRRTFGDLIVAPVGEVLRRVYPNGLPAPRVEIPVLLCGGWWDNLKGTQLDDWASVQSAPASRQQRLEMGATDHYSERFSLGDSPSESPDFASPDFLSSLLESPLRFLEGHLGIGALDERPRVRYEVANRGWHESETWPPPSAQVLELHLTDAGAAPGSAQGGGLSETRDNSPTFASWLHDPQCLVPSLSPSDFHVLPVLPDEHEVQERSDVLTFTSDSFRSPVDIVGHVRCVLNIESDAPFTSVIVSLSDVATDGRSHLITEGSSLAWTGGVKRRVSVDVGDTAYRLLPGRRLRVSVSTSRFPRYLPPSGTEDSAWLVSERQPIRHVLHTGGHDGSFVRMGILPAAASG
jgi:putative CocE/NonD family hydrolase